MEWDWSIDPVFGTAVLVMIGLLFGALIVIELLDLYDQWRTRHER